MEQPSRGGTAPGRARARTRGRGREAALRGRAEEVPEEERCPPVPPLCAGPGSLERPSRGLRQRGGRGAMADRSLEGMALPLEVRARLAELELELSEGNRPGRAAPRCRREAAAGWAGGRVVSGALGPRGACHGPHPGHCVSPPGCAAAGPGARDGAAGLAGPCPCARPRAAPAAQAGDVSRRSACGALALF